MDLERLSSELIRHLRGSRSQAWIGRRLGYAANVVYTWESGRRFPPSSAFFRLAKIAKVPLYARLRAFLGPEIEVTLSDAWTKRDTARILQAMHQDTPATELARRVGANRTTLARWFAGRTEPRLPELLGFVQATTHRLVEFVGAFAEPQELATLRRIHRDLAAQERLAYDLPWSHAVLRALEVKAYRSRGHSPGFIAERTGLTLAEEESYLRELSKAGQIQWRGGRWHVRRVLTIDTRRQPEKNRRLKDHWAEVALGRLRAGALERGALFSYNLAAVSHADLEEIRRLHVDYYERVRQVVEKSKHADRVILVEQQLVPLDA